MANLREFTNDNFITGAKRTLETDGFVTDEHSFAPYRETIVEKYKEIEELLRQAGYNGGKLAKGYTKHRAAAYAYYVYDTKKFNGITAKAAVLKWLDHEYRQ
jgi:hypothetical protein